MKQVFLGCTHASAFCCWVQEYILRDPSLAGSRSGGRREHGQSMPPPNPSVPLLIVLIKYSCEHNCLWVLRVPPASSEYVHVLRICVTHTYTGLILILISSKTSSYLLSCSLLFYFLLFHFILTGLMWGLYNSITLILKAICILLYDTWCPNVMLLGSLLSGHHNLCTQLQCNHIPFFTILCKKHSLSFLRTSTLSNARKT